MSAKKTKGDLGALFNLEFYRKQNNWKFCSQVLKDKKGTTKDITKATPDEPVDKPEKKYFNKTYNVETNDCEESILNEAFVETDNDKNNSTPPNSPSSPTNWPPEFIKVSDKWSPCGSQSNEITEVLRSDKQDLTYPEVDTPKDDSNLRDQFANICQNWSQKYINYDQNWPETAEKADQNITQEEFNQNMALEMKYDINWLQEITKYRQKYMNEKTTYYQDYQQNNLNWPENIQQCQEPQSKVMQSWANIALNQTAEKYLEENNNNIKTDINWTRLNEISETIIDNWHYWKEQSQKVPNMTQNMPIFPQYIPNMPQILQNIPNMPQSLQNIPNMSQNMPDMPQDPPKTPQHLPPPQTWSESLWQNDMVSQDCQYKDLPEMDKDGYEGTEAGWPLETQVWTNHKLNPNAVWSENVLRELELLNAGELDPVTPVNSEKWVPPDRLLQWMLANKECCDDVLETSSDSEEQFIQGAHCVPHSSATDIRPQLDELDTSTDCEELVTEAAVAITAGEEVGALSESRLRAMGRAHARALRRVADELRNRERTQRSRSNSRPSLHTARSDSCEEYPTRDIGLYQPYFIDTFISGSYKNNPNNKNLEKQIDQDLGDTGYKNQLNSEGAQIFVDRGQIRLNRGQMSLNRGQTGLNYDQTGLKNNKTVLGREKTGLDSDQMSPNWDQIGLNKGQIDLNMRIESGEIDLDQPQMAYDKCQISLGKGQPGNSGDCHLIGRGRGRLPVRDYEIGIGRGRGRI